MLRVFSVILVLILSPTNLASFDEVWDKYFDFYSEVLEAPFLIEVNNTVEDDCWTNIEAARKAIWEPLSEMGIETARATYNYIELSVDGYREGRTCFGNIQIQIKIVSIPVAANWSAEEAGSWPAQKVPTLFAEVISKSKLITSKSNLDKKIIPVIDDFMQSFKRAMNRH